MAKKLKLVSSSDMDYSLIGIASHLKDYRLIWLLNEILDLRFVKMTDLRAFNDKLNEMLTYPLYYFEQPDSFKSWYFFGNYNEKAFLIQEHKQTHFFILVKGSLSAEFLSEINLSVRKVKNILAVHAISINLIKNMDLILSDLELHMMEISKKTE